MIVRVEINCDNAAFDDDAGVEVGRILRELATKLSSRGNIANDSLNLMDINGNVVGSCLVGEDAMELLQEEWHALNSEHAFIALAVNWHGGQWSAFYKLQCNGRILDAQHAHDVYIEARDDLAKIGPEHGDYDALEALRDIADKYPEALGEED
jgi:hypothetical protein